MPDPEQSGDEPTPGDDPTYPDQPMVDEDPEVPGDELTVYEADLEDVTESGQQDVSVSGSMSIYAPDVLASVVVSFGGKDVELFNGQTASFDIGVGDNGAAGVFEASYKANTGKLEYKFTLNDDHQHDPKLDSAEWTVGVTVKDSDESTDATSIKLTIVDDKPVAVDDYAGIVKANTSLAENATVVTSGEKTSLAGSVLTGEATAEGHEAAALKADTLGADGVNGVTWAATATVGEQTVAIVNGKAVTDYGTLTLNADGTYSFTIADSAAVHAMAEGETVTVSVGYTITDADGDSSTATLTLNVEGSDDGITIVPRDPDGEGPVLSGDQVIVHESALENGNPAPEEGVVTAYGSMEIAAPDGLDSIKIGETEVWKNGSLTETTTVSTDEGVLTVTGYDAAKGELRFSFTLNQATQEHSNQGEDRIAHRFDVTVSDKDGDPASSSIVVTIVDDMPVVAVAGTADEATSFDSDGDQQADGTQSLSGKFTVNFGADDMANAPFALVDGEKTKDFELVDGKYSVTTPEGGTLTLVPGEGGEYAYTYAPSTKNDSFFGRKFTIQMKDKDGDTVTTTVTVERDFTPDLAIGNDRIVVDEGTQPEEAHDAVHAQSGTGSFTVDLHGELGSISVGGKSVVVDGQSVVSAEAPASVTVHGVEISITSAQLSSDGLWTVSYSYKLTEAQDHGPDGKAEDTALIGSVDIRVTDPSQDSVDGTITVEVHDDVPTIAASVGATVLTLPDNDSETPDPLFVTTGSVTASAGADGFPSGVENYVVFDGEAMGDSLAVVVNGEPEPKTAFLRISDGGLTLTATVGSDTLFSAVLTTEGGLTVNQYDNFTLSVDVNGTSAQSNTLPLHFVTRDGDSDHDTATASVDIPLKLGVSVGSNKDNDGSNDADQAAIQLGDDSAGHVAAGDTGGSDVSTTTTAPKNYNVSIILDISASMNDQYSSSGPSAGQGGSRMEMAVDALTNFIGNYLSQHTGIVNLQVVGFGSSGSGAGVSSRKAIRRTMSCRRAGA